MTCNCSYAALHVHTQYSIDGVGTIEQYVDSAMSKGLYGLGISDHGVFSSALELHKIGKKKNFPVLMGEEFYITEDHNVKRHYHHITVWAKNETGYKNMCILSSLAFKDDYFSYKPRITYDLLCQYGDGLVVGSGCFVGEINYSLLIGNTNRAIQLTDRLRSRFGDDFYMEIMPALVIYDERSYNKMGEGKFKIGTNMQLVENEAILEFARKHDIKFLCSSDAHMPDLSMKSVQQVKMWNRSKNWEFDYAYYLHSTQDFYTQWTKEFGLDETLFVDGCATSREIINKGKNIDLKFDLKTPKIDYGRFPHYVEGIDNKTLVIKLIKHHGKINLKDMKYVNRLSKEIKVLADNGSINLLDYFLLLEDVCRFCVQNNIAVGVGRGSAGGSLLAYALNITDVDPMRWNLSFERFINPARIKKGAYPDIDLDIESVRRSEVIDYIHSTYGEDKVAQFGTIHTIKLKTAIKDTIRILDKSLSQEEVDQLCASIPWIESDKHDVDSMIAAAEQSTKLTAYFKSKPDIKEATIQALGQMRQYGVHAAAIAISPEPIMHFVPLARKSGDKHFYTQYPMDKCAEAGLIKYDILGLKTLSDIRVCLELVKSRHNKSLNPWRDIALDDEKTLSAFRRGHTVTVFQFNTEAFSDLLRGVKNVYNLNFNDLVVLNTLGRPGTFDTGMHTEWINRRRGVAEVPRLHKSIAPILADTYGIILYQEQVMAVIKALAGFDDSEADDMRRAIGKKDSGAIEEYGKMFISKVPTKHPDIDVEAAKSCWELIKAFGRYSFNMSHSVAYSQIAYVCQYLKVHYPSEWWCAVLRNEEDDDKRRYYFKYIKSIMSSYDINTSGTDYQIHNKTGAIIPPITSIKFISAVISDLILKHRPFLSFEHFLDVASMEGHTTIFKKNVVINMIIGGLFDNIANGKTTKDLIEMYYKVRLDARLKRDGQPNKAMSEYIDKYSSLSVGEFQKLKMDILPHNSVNLNELLFKEDAEKYQDYADVLGGRDGDEIQIVGLVLNTHQVKTKKGDTMFFSTISNQGESISLTVFPSHAIKLRDTFRRGNIIAVEGSINRHNGKFGVVVDSATQINL